MTDEDDFDYLYGDLEIQESEKEKELREANERLLLENDELKEKLGVLRRRHNERLEQTRILTRNLSSLIKTARSEVSRKNSTISELKKKYEDLVFKRTSPEGFVPVVLDPKDLTPKLSIPPKLKPYKNGDLDCCPEVRDLFVDASKGFHRVSCGQNSVTFIRHESVPESGNKDIIYLRLDDGTLGGKKSLPSKTSEGKMFVMTPSEYKSLKRKRKPESNSVSNKKSKSEEPKRDNSLLENKDVNYSEQRLSSTRNSKQSSSSSRSDKYYGSKRYDSKKHSSREERYSKDKHRVSPDSSSRRGTYFKEKSLLGHNISSKVASDKPLCESNRYSNGKSDTYRRKQSRENCTHSSRDSTGRQPSSSFSSNNSSLKSHEKSSSLDQKCENDSKFKLSSSVKGTKVSSKDKRKDGAEKVDPSDLKTRESRKSINTNKTGITAISIQCNSQTLLASKNNKMGENKFIDRGSEKISIISSQTTSTDGTSFPKKEIIKSDGNSISTVNQISSSEKNIELKSDCLVDNLGVNNGGSLKLQKPTLKDSIKKNDKNNYLSKNSLYMLKRKKEECKIKDTISEPIGELSDTDNVSKVDNLSEFSEKKSENCNKSMIPTETSTGIDANSSSEVITEISLVKFPNEVRNHERDGNIALGADKIHLKESMILKDNKVSRDKKLKYDIDNRINCQESSNFASEDLVYPSKTTKGVTCFTSVVNQPKSSSTNNACTKSLTFKNSSQDQAEFTNCKSNLNDIMKGGKESVNKENISTNKLKISPESNNFNQVSSSVREALLADLELSDSEDESALDIIFNTADTVDSVKSEGISSKSFSSRYSSMDRYPDLSENKTNIGQTNSTILSDKSSSDVNSSKKSKQLPASKQSREKLNVPLFDDSELEVSDPSQKNSRSKSFKMSSDHKHVDQNKGDSSEESANIHSNNKSSNRSLVSDEDGSIPVNEYLYQNCEMFNTPVRDTSSSRTLKRINTDELENMITSRQSLMTQLIEEEKICKEKLSQVYMISPVKYCQDDKFSSKEPGEISSSESEEELVPAYSTPMSKVPATPTNMNVNFNSTAGIASILRDDLVRTAHISPSSGIISTPPSGAISSSRKRNQISNESTPVRRSPRKHPRSILYSNLSGTKKLSSKKSSDFAKTSRYLFGDDEAEEKSFSRSKKRTKESNVRSSKNRK